MANLGKILLLLLLFLLLVPGLKPVRIRWYKSNDTPTRCRTFRSDLHLYDTTCKHTCPEAIAITFVLGIFFTVKREQQKWKTSSSIIASKRVKAMLRVLPPVKSVSQQFILLQVSYSCWILLQNALGPVYMEWGTPV